jgi:hypothetical protein
MLRRFLLLRGTAAGIRASRHRREPSIPVSSGSCPRSSFSLTGSPLPIRLGPDSGVGSDRPSCSVLGRACRGPYVTHKLARTLAKDPVTSPLRAPFTQYEGVSGPLGADRTGPRAGWPGMRSASCCPACSAWPSGSGRYTPRGSPSCPRDPEWPARPSPVGEAGNRSAVG